MLRPGLCHLRMSPQADAGLSSKEISPRRITSTSFQDLQLTSAMDRLPSSSTFYRIREDRFSVFGNTRSSSLKRSAGSWVSPLKDGTPQEQSQLTSKLSNLKRLQLSLRSLNTSLPTRFPQFYLMTRKLSGTWLKRSKRMPPLRAWTRP